MESQRLLLWEQGLFLQPQHFQLLDRSFHALLAPYFSFVRPYFWGVGGIAVREADLATNDFTLYGGRFLFRDGTYVVLDREGKNGVIESPRSFDDAWKDRGKAFRVYVGIKKWDPTGKNVTRVERLEGFHGVTTRFVTPDDPGSVQDLHLGEGKTGDVKELHYFLKIFWEQERVQQADYLMLPVAELEQTGDHVRLSQRYVPPSLSLSSSDVLEKLVVDIRNQVTASIRGLEEHKAQRGMLTVDMGSVGAALALASIGHYVPFLDHCSESTEVREVIHPWAVYGALRQLVGVLSTFSAGVSVRGETDGGSIPLPAYNHDALYECFSAAQELLSNLFREIGPEGPGIPLVFDGTYYAAQLPPDLFQGSHRYYLTCETQHDPKDMIECLTRIAKFHSRIILPKLMGTGTPGVVLKPLDVPPPELPLRRGLLCFSIDGNSERWQEVMSAGDVALLWPPHKPPPDDVKFELRVVRIHAPRPKM